MTLVSFDHMLLIREVAEHLKIDAGLITYEYPGCVVIPLRDAAEPAYWWFGNANETWQGDLQSTAGEHRRTLDTGVPRDCKDASMIARGIATALLDDAQGPIFHAGRFSIETIKGPVVLAGWTLGDTWNGFATPAFEREAADALMAAINADPEDLDISRLSYEEALDRFRLHLVGRPEEEDEFFEGFLIATPEGPRKTYSIGAYSWTWTEITPRSEAEWNEEACGKIFEARAELDAAIEKAGEPFADLAHASRFLDVNALAFMDREPFIEREGDRISEACHAWHERILANLDAWLKRGRREVLAEREFELTYDVPNAVILEPEIEDCSWHNDTMPSFTFPEINGSGSGEGEQREQRPDIRLWIDHPIQSLREIPEQEARFYVFNHSTSIYSYASEALYYGDDLDLALAALRKARAEARR